MRFMTPYSLRGLGGATRRRCGADAESAGDLPRHLVEPS
ncbi:hypothetical protein BJ969_002844 [Saccharopolyspora gloriosae]|uniref:Uncharacterized protein n=1 Tax=Saccharopolyspora gloriosae TaxID=455344 RepID=A0A840NBU0_9PSEU|nr:hypothetical protein [Saccharopolyspora gloriosae]